MNKTPFIINIGDLLRIPWSKDTYTLTSVMTDHIPGLTSDGITVKISLQTLNSSTLLISIITLYATIHELCDKSWEMYNRVVSDTSFEWRFVTADQRIHEDPLDDDVYNIDPKNETINIEDFIVQAVLFQEPLVHISPAYLETHPQDDYIIDDSTYDIEHTIDHEAVSTQWVIFR